MPGVYVQSAMERDPRRWERVLQQVADQMVAAGWVRKAGKFPEVQRRKARALAARW